MRLAWKPRDLEGLRISQDITGSWLANVLPQEGPGGEYLQEKSTSFLALNSGYQGAPPDFPNIHDLILERTTLNFTHVKHSKQKSAMKYLTSISALSLKHKHVWFHL